MATRNPLLVSSDENVTKMVPSMRLSSREVEQLLQDQKRHAKLTRLHQVREQASRFSRKVCQDAGKAQRRELQSIEDRIDRDARRELVKVVSELEAEALTCLTDFGKAHVRAGKENDASRSRLEEGRRNRLRANSRGEEALRELRARSLRDLRKKDSAVEARRRALETEAVRSSYITSLPPVVVKDRKTVEDEPQPKVVLFDKRSLFQTQYSVKEKMVEVVANPQDARQAALQDELETDLRCRQAEQNQLEAELRVKRRGVDAMSRQKSHLNYLRLLEELDKLETKTESPPGEDDRWNIESSLASIDVDPVCDKFAVEEPVRDSMVSQTSFPHRQDVNRPKEIRQLLQELKAEQEKLRAEASAPLISRKELLTSTETSEKYPLKQLHVERPLQPSEKEFSSPSAVGSNGSIVYDDDSVEIRVQVTQTGSSSTSGAGCCQEKNENSMAETRNDEVIANVLPEHLKQKNKIGPSQSLTCSAASTPLRTDAPIADSKQGVLRNYVQKLMHMKRQDVGRLSVGSSFTSFTTNGSSDGSPVPASGYYKPLCRGILKPTLSPPFPPPQHRLVQQLPEHPWPEEIAQERDESDEPDMESTISSSYDSPDTATTPDRSSTLPLGVEASVFTTRRKSEVRSNDLFSLKPLLDVYSDVYRAYNNRKTINQQQLPEVSLEASQPSSFMSLTLSTDGASLDCTSEGRTFRSNLALTVSSSSASSCDSSTLPSTLSTPALRKKRALRINSSAATSNVSWETPESSKERPNIALSSASTDDVSMPDVDEALRRLGLPSMQSVLRR